MLFSKVSVWFRILCEGTPAIHFKIIPRPSALDCIWRNCDKIVPTEQFDSKERFLQLMQFLLKKLQTLSLENQIMIHPEEPPYKKCKFTPLKCLDTPFCILSEENEKEMQVQKSQKKKHTDPKPKFHRRPRSHSLPYVRLKSGLVKRSCYSEKKTPNIISVLPPLKIECSASRSGHELGYFFSTCINFQKPSSFSNVDDVDWVIRSVTGYGQVLKIQNHWNRSGPKQQWCGAMVIYKSKDDCQQVIKRLHADRFTCLTPIYIPQHLKLIGKMEDRLLKTLNPEQKQQGSTVKIFGILHKSPSNRRLKQEIEQYGNVLSFYSNQDSQDKRYSVWEVTYQYTVEAVAAVLGLDGKFNYKGRLSALLEMGEKEKCLNLMVAGYI